MSKHMTIIKLACTITKLRKWGEAWKHSAESAQATTARIQQANKELEREKLMTAGLIDKLIADRDAAWKERDTQAAEHEAKMVEHRAAFGVRTEADAKIIAGLREELDRVRNSLGIQAAKEANKVLGMVEGLRGAAERVVKERDALRAEVAALQERLRASIARGDFAQMEVVDLKAQLEKLKSQSKAPKYNVGDKLESYNRSLGLAIPVTVVGVRTVYDCQADGAEYPVGHSEAELKERYSQTPKHPGEPCDPPTVKRVPNIGDTVQLVRRPTKQDYEWSWLDQWGKVGESFRVVSGVCTYNKTPSVLVEIRGEIYSWPLSCVEVVAEATHDTEAGKAAAESAVKTDPKPGDTVRLVRIPSRSDVSPKLQTTLEWPWIERWGTLNQTALVVEPAYQLAGAVSVCLSANVHARWPICCVEVVRTEPDDIKVGDLVEVFQSSSTWTFTDDVGKSGTITRIETDPVSRTEIVHLREHPDDDFALCDVRKVTT